MSMEWKQRNECRACLIRLAIWAVIVVFMDVDVHNEIFMVIQHNVIIL